MWYAVTTTVLTAHTGSIFLFLGVSLVRMDTGEEPSIGEWTLGNMKLLPPLGRRVVAPNLLFFWFLQMGGRTRMVTSNA